MLKVRYVVENDVYTVIQSEMKAVSETDICDSLESKNLLLTSVDRMVLNFSLLDRRFVGH